MTNHNTRKTGVSISFTRIDNETFDRIIYF